MVFIFIMIQPYYNVRLTVSSIKNHKKIANLIIKPYEQKKNHHVSNFYIHGGF